MRVAFAGAGRMARLHLHALRRVRTPHFVAAVCDTSDSAAREVAALAGAVAYTSLAELLREAQPSLVHVCTPAGTHYQPARQALLAGAHVYVEKPFVETQREARELLGLARDRGLLVCAGHQQVRDPAYRKLMARVPALGAVAQVDSHFAFRPVGMNPERAGPKALAAQLLDILPHPLYTLIAALEGCRAAGRRAPSGLPARGSSRRGGTRSGCPPARPRRAPGRAPSACGTLGRGPAGVRHTRASRGRGPARAALAPRAASRRTASRRRRARRRAAPDERAGSESPRACTRGRDSAALPAAARRATCTPRPPPARRPPAPRCRTCRIPRRRSAASARVAGHGDEGGPSCRRPRRRRALARR